MDYPRKRDARNCVWCHKIFHPAFSEIKRGNGRFCSLSCVAHYRNKHYMKPRKVNLKTYKCFFCGKEFKRRPYKAINKRQFCSLGCFYTFNRGLQPGTMQRNVKRKVFKIAFESYGKRCEICGYALSVDVHHLIPRSQGGTNDPGNLSVLCPNHHREADLGILRPEDIVNLRKIGGDGGI